MEKATLESDVPATTEPEGTEVTANCAAAPAELGVNALLVAEL